MKLYVVGVILTFIGALVLGVFLTISPEDIALMFLKGKKYKEAEAYYKARYARGERSASVVVPLRSLEMTKGNIDAAIALLEEHITLFPKDTNALKLLAELYLLDMRRDLHYETLAKLNEIEPTKERLQDLSSWYGAKRRFEQQEAVLNTMIDNNVAKREDYYELAYMFTKQKNYSRALFVLEQLREENFKKYTIEDLELETSLLFYLEKTLQDPALSAQALKITANSLMRWQNPQSALKMLLYFRSEKPHLAYALTDYLYFLGKQYPPLMGQILSVWFENGKVHQAYETLLQIYALEYIDPTMIDLFVNVLLQKGELLLLADFFDHTDLRAIPSMTLIAIAQLSLIYRQPQVGYELMERLGDSFLQKNPPIQAAIHTAARLRRGFYELENLDLKALSNEEVKALMFVAAEASFSDLALKYLSHLMPFYSFDKQEIFDMAHLFITKNLSEETYPLFQQASEKLPPEKIDPSLMLFATEQLDSDKVIAFLKQEKELKEPMLITFYTVAQNSGDSLVMLQASHMLYENYPKDANTRRYAFALLRNDQVKEGLELFTQLYNRDPSRENELGYLTALIQSLEQYPENKAKVLTFIHDYLETVELNRDFLKQLAFLLIEHTHEIETASTILEKISEKSAPNSSEVQSLLYVWGPRPPAYGIKWLVNRAKNAPMATKGQWLEILNSRGAHEITVQLVAPKDLKNFEVVTAYLQALIELKQFARLNEVGLTLIEKTSKVSELEKIGALTETLDDKTLAKAVWHKVHEIAPNDPEAVMFLARLNYYDSDYSESYCFYQKYFAFFKEGMYSAQIDPIDLYFFANILKRQYAEYEANQLFEKSIAKIDQMTSPSVYLETLKANSLLSLHRKEEAVAFMRLVYTRTHESLPAQIALGNLLIDAKNYPGAYDVLFNPQTGDNKDHLSLKFKKEVSYTSALDGKSLLLTFDQKIPEKAILDLLEESKGVVQNVEYGFNTLLLTPVEDVFFDLSHHEKEVLITMIPKPAQKSYELDIAKARYLVETWNFEHAFHYLKQLEEQYPDKGEVYFLKSEAGRVSTYWQKSLDWINAALAYDPDHEIYQQLYRDVLMQHASTIDVSHTFEKIPRQSYEHLTKVNLNYLSHHDDFFVIHLGGMYEKDRANYASVTQENGSLLPFEGERFRGDFSAHLEMKSGIDLKALGYFNERYRLFGGGLESRFLSNSKTVHFDLYYHKPNWDTLETVVFNGYSDSFLVGAKVIFHRRYNLFVSFEPTRYHLDYQKNIATTFNVEALGNLFITYGNPLVMLQYNLDAEYIHSRNEQLDPEGQNYLPINLSNRENHTFKAFMKITMYRYFELSGFVGETYNRFGKGDMTGGISFRYFHDKAGILIEGSAEKSASTFISNSDQQTAKGSILWTF